MSLIQNNTLFILGALCPGAVCHWGGLSVGDLSGAICPGALCPGAICPEPKINYPWDDCRSYKYYKNRRDPADHHVVIVDEPKDKW